jgi:hypothetical protein
MRTEFEKDLAELTASYSNNGTTPPYDELLGNPIVVGQMWFDPTTRKGFVYDGESWVDTGTKSLL